MADPRFYSPLPLAPGARFSLPEAVARHAVRVLRLPPGAGITLFDGRGGEYPAIIEGIHKDQVSVAVGAWDPVERESPLRIRLVQALQAADKMDYTLQKAVELGVAAIQPVGTRRSVTRLDGERATKRVAHWQGVVVSACEQCGRNQIPSVAPVMPLVNWLGQPSEAPLRLILAPGAETPLSALPRATAVDLLVGAEGGLDPEEISLARQQGFQAVSLGPRILRTETAGLAAIAIMQALWGDIQPRDGAGGHHAG